jgi:ATP-dependent DNA helicase RecG
MKEAKLTDINDDESLLINLGVAKKVKNRISLNNAGVLFFAKNPAKFFMTSKVVVNPGGLVKWLKPEEFGTISKTRNPIIASLLARTIFVEKLGTGINRIRKAMESSNLPAPEFKFYEYSFYVNLFDETMIKLVETVGSKLVENQLKIVLLILEDEKITKNRMSEILNISDTAVDKNILKLKNLGIIKRVGPAKGGHWEVKE